MVAVTVLAGSTTLSFAVARFSVALLSPFANATDKAARAAFDKIGDRVSEVPPEGLAATAAALWLALPDAVREATGLLTQGPALRREINAAVRRGLLGEGSLSGPAREVERLVAAELGPAALADPASYAPGDTVIFLRPYKRLGVGKGDERAEGIVFAAGLITLATARAAWMQSHPASKSRLR